MAIHVQTWSGSKSARITDMTNAGKRGKTCRVLRMQGVPWDLRSGDDLQQLAASLSYDAYYACGKLNTSMSYDDAASAIKAIIDAAHAEGVPAGHLGYYEKTIRGVDAPVPVLTASGDGWTASADKDGVHIHDEKDQNNLPAMITPHGQKSSQAYKFASQVWDQVEEAKSFHQVGEILSLAGCKLHYYFRMD